ncbi:MULTISPECIES: hypothetical protein [Brevibacterium]|uniref:hypothetical protein n=1 Tax=Brevibacterium TaxID=1696 RepID=UPI0021A4481A|nr:hypothetical protein [Brevibacterium sp. p3-SID960]MCT1691270.1 hypothetical protein [Brevibacterium sp. p3-SID960]
MTPWFPIGIAVLAWSLLALAGGLATVGYLVLGVTMTDTLEGVFGPEPEYLFNWIILWTVLIGQLLGLVIALAVALLGLRQRRRGRRFATAAMVLGFVAAGIFLLIGVLQLPLYPILFDALAL